MFSRTKYSEDTLTDQERKRYVLAKGGPYHGKFLLLSSIEGTAQFKVGCWRGCYGRDGWRGRYAGDGEWIDHGEKQEKINNYPLSS